MRHCSKAMQCDGKWDCRAAGGGRDGLVGAKTRCTSAYDVQTGHCDPRHHGSVKPDQFSRWTDRPMFLAGLVFNGIQEHDLAEAAPRRIQRTKVYRSIPGKQREARIRRQGGKCTRATTTRSCHTRLDHASDNLCRIPLAESHSLPEECSRIGHFLDARGCHAATPVHTKVARLGAGTFVDAANDRMGGPGRRTFGRHEQERKTRKAGEPWQASRLPAATAGTQTRVWQSPAIVLCSLPQHGSTSS